MTTDPQLETLPLPSPYLSFPRESWAALRGAVPVALSEPELAELSGLTETVSLVEVTEVYLPLARLLDLHVAARRRLHRTAATFLGAPVASVPYVVGIAGSVAVGKSTTARVLRALLARVSTSAWRVELVSTDGFLHPNAELVARGLMRRKGFPESYDVRSLLRFLAEVKSGSPSARAPVYSHLAYDIVPGEWQVVTHPDVLIVEGLNVLQTGAGSPVFVSDFFDFSIYVDAEVEHLRAWYVERFLRLRDAVFRDPASYFHRYAALSEREAREVALGIWRDINEVNLLRNILPTRERADLILEKGADHAVRRVRLRRL